MHYFFFKEQWYPRKRALTNRQGGIGICGRLGDWLMAEKNRKYSCFFHFSENIFSGDIFGYRG